MTASRRSAGIGFTIALAPVSARASFLHGDALDALANGLAIFILFAVPIGAIILFWLVHVLPEKVAEKRHHPQKEAIKVLCLLSLVFGGMLWPFAWIWAYSKPVLHKLAYGTDKHEDFYLEQVRPEAGSDLTPADEVARIEGELAALAARGVLPDELLPLRERLVALEAKLSTPRLEP